MLLFRRLLVCTLIFISFLSAKQISITGTVLDSLSHAPITDVNVIIQDTDIGTTTDKYGYFVLQIEDNHNNQIIIFTHIKYTSKDFLVPNTSKQFLVNLRMKNIELKGVEIEGHHQNETYQQPIYNKITEIKMQGIDIRGFTDIGDIIANEQSVTLEENLNGKKSISIRGANSNEIMVLYDGIQINNRFDNSFDLAIFDPGSVEQVDIIKGSSPSSFGSFGSIASVNIIPKNKQSYLAKFHQRIGSYNSGNWGLNLFKNIYGINIFSSFNRSGSTMDYIQTNSNTGQLTRFNDSKMVNVNYDFGDKLKHAKRHKLNVHWLSSEQKYDNELFFDHLNSNMEITNLKYNCNLEDYGKFGLIISRHISEEKHDQDYISLNSQHEIIDETLKFSGFYQLPYNNINTYINYYREYSVLDYFRSMTLVPDNEVYSDNTKMDRQRSGISASMQFSPDKLLGKILISDITYNMTGEFVNTNLPDSMFNSVLEDNNSYWSESSGAVTISYKYLTNPYILLSGYVNCGINYTIPSLYQHILSQTSRIYLQNHILLPEFKQTVDIGVDLHNTANNNRFPFKGSIVFFYNKYTDKFRKIYMSGSPVEYFDNHAKTNILGIESSASIDIIPDRLGISTGYSKYRIGDLQAFPFKPKYKITAGINFRYKDFNTEVIWFRESEKNGIILNQNDFYEDVSLESFQNIDIHSQYQLKISKVNTFITFSGRNIFSKEKNLYGIALRDRRFYLTLGCEI